MTDTISLPLKPHSPMVMILLKDNVLLGQEQVQKKIVEILGPGTSLSFSGEGADQSGVITWRDQNFAVFTVDHAVPETEFFATLRMSPNGEELTQIVKNHGAHMVISPLDGGGDMGAAINQSITLMAFATGMAELGQVMGYFWSTSEHLLTPDGFNGALEQALDAASGGENQPQQLPVSFWVSIRPFSDKNKTAVLTQGLNAFTGYETEIAFVDRPADVLFARMSNIVMYLFANGPVLQPGQSIGVSESEQFDVSLEPHVQTGTPTMMLRLQEGS